MRQRTSALPMRVAKYYCRGPTSHRDLFEEQLQRARAYRNQLVEIERDRRARYRELAAEHASAASVGAEVLECEARLEALRARLKGARQSSRSRTRDPNISDQAHALRDKLKELRAQLARERAALRDDPRMVAACLTIEHEAKAAIKLARAESGLYWGTYQLVEAAVEAARRSKRDPHFVSADGGGRIGLQFQGGTHVRDILDGRSQLLRIDPLPGTQWQTRSGRRAARTTVHFRVASDARRKAVWVEFPMLMHRPLPEDGVVKRAAIIKKRVAQRSVYELQLVLEAESFAAQSAPKSAPMAAINFGWRVRPEGLRVAMLVDEFGREREFVLPRRLLDKLDHADSIRGVRERDLALFRPRLIEALALLPEPHPWMDEARQTMRAWRSAERFTRFVLRWMNERVAQDEAAFALADAWRRRDLHLMQYETYERRGAREQRRNLYRVIAKEAATFDAIVLEAFDLRRVSRHPTPEDEATRHRPHHRNRQRAAVSELRKLISERARCVVDTPRDNTHTCHQCDSVQAFDANTQLIHTCSECGASWDQDVNCAKNLLRRHREPCAASLDAPVEEGRSVSKA